MIAADISKEDKLKFISKSDCTNLLVKMAQTPDYNFSSSGNRIRNGFMGFVIKLANLIVKMKTTYSASDDFNGDDTFKKVYSKDWEKFVEGELENSNDRNSKNLGGRPTSTTSDDDETNQFEVNMDNIMKRFQCFNNTMQNYNSSTDDDEKEDDEQAVEEPDRENEAESEGRQTLVNILPEKEEEERVKVQVTLPDAFKINSDYADSSYWKIRVDEGDLDSLLSDYQ